MSGLDVAQTKDFYLKEKVFWEEFLGPFIDFLKGKTVYEMNCGTGLNSDFLVSLCSRLYFQDLNQTFLDAAMDRLFKMGKGLL